MWSVGGYEDRQEGRQRYRGDSVRKHTDVGEVAVGEAVLLVHVVQEAFHYLRVDVRMGGSSA